MPSGFIFTEASGVADSVFGKCQNPIRMFLEQRGEAMQQASCLKDLFLMGTSENYGDEFATTTAMNDFEPVGENGAYPSNSMQEGFRQFMEYMTWKSKFELTLEAIEDAKLLDLKKQPASFLTAYERTREKFGAFLFGTAIKGTGTGNFRGKNFSVKSADGKNIFATDHPAMVSGANQTNCFADAFSAANLGKMETRMHLFCGDNEEILDVAPDTILIPEDATLKNSVFSAIGADKDPNTSNNAFNYQYGRWNVIVWPYLNQFITSGTSPWILLDSKYNQTYGGAIWNDRIKLAIRSTIDENTDANVWRGRSRFNACFNDWRFAAVGGVTGGSNL